VAVLDLKSVSRFTCTAPLIVGAVIRYDVTWKYGHNIVCTRGVEEYRQSCVDAGRTCDVVELSESQNRDDGQDRSTGGTDGTESRESDDDAADDAGDGVGDEWADGELDGEDDNLDSVPSAVSLNQVIIQQYAAIDGPIPSGAYIAAALGLPLPSATSSLASSVQSASIAAAAAAAAAAVAALEADALSQPAVNNNHGSDDEDDQKHGEDTFAANRVAASLATADTPSSPTSATKRKRVDVQPSRPSPVSNQALPTRSLFRYLFWHSFNLKCYVMQELVKASKRRRKGVHGVHVPHTLFCVYSKVLNCPFHCLDHCPFHCLFHCLFHRRFRCVSPPYTGP
jgi:hypothetical protein